MKLKTFVNVKILGTWGELVEQVGSTIMYEDTEPLEQLVQLIQNNDEKNPYSLLIEKPCGCTMTVTSSDITGATCQKHDNYYITREELV